MHLSLSVPRVEGADLRPWVPAEHSLVISSAQSHAASSTDAAKPGQDSSNVLDWDSASFLTLDMHTAAQMSVIKLQVGPRPSSAASALALVSKIALATQVPQACLDSVASSCQSLIWGKVIPTNDQAAN